MRHRLTYLVLSALALMAALPAFAHASDAAYEPNDGIQEAYGPLAAGTNYDGTISSSGDEDWFVFYVSGPGVFDVALTNLADSLPSYYGDELDLRDQNGKLLNSEYADENETGHLPYTAPAAGRYYVVVDGSIGDDYRLRVSGPITSGPRPGPAQATPNGHFDLASALGPLAGGTLYGGSIDAYEEEDWFYFYSAGAGTFDVALTNSSDELPSYYGDEISLRDQDGEVLNSASADENEIAHVVYTTPGPAKFVLRVRGSVDDHYQLEITPAGLLTSTPPPAAAPPAPAAAAKPAVSPQCKQARTERKKALRKVTFAKRKLRIAKKQIKKVQRAKAKRKWRKQKRRWAKAIQKRRVVLRAANEQTREICT